MRLWLLLTPALFVGCVGCGYVGPVLPPSPMLPTAVTDLTVIERGDQIIISFTTPPRTTDNIPVEQFSEIDLRIGVASVPFDFERWAAAAKGYELEPPDAGDPQNPIAVPMSKTVQAREWIGKRIAVAVRTSVKKKDHFSSWSNRVVLNVIPALKPPEVKADSTAKGVLLTWSAAQADLTYRIYRKTATDSAASQLGTSNTPSYVDATSQYDTPYEYTVIAAQGLAESLPSKPEPITTKDIFPPSIPSAVTALAGPNSIELSWGRSPEADLKGYLVYRSVGSGPSERVGDLQPVPIFSDRGVQHGKTYRYQVSAVDQKNNSSDKSAPVSVIY